MTAINQNLQRIIDDFADRHLNGRNSTEYQNLTSAITASPELTERLNTAADRGYLTDFGVNTNSNAGASYNAEETRVSISLNMLQTSKAQPKLIFQLGHEIQHGFYHYEQGGKEVEEQTQKAIRAIARSNAAVKDYTPPLKTMLATDRENEAKAMLVGWNAVVSYAKQSNSKPDLKYIVGRDFDYSDYFLSAGKSDKQGNPIAVSGLKFNADMSLPLTAQNTETLARTYFDQHPDDARLGRHGDSDYRNSYAGRYIGFIAQEHREHAPDSKLVIDMKSLGLQEQLIERNGLNLGAYVRDEYYDRSDMKTPRYFDHTADGPNRYQHVPITRAADREEERDEEARIEAMIERMNAKISSAIDAYERNDREGIDAFMQKTVQSTAARELMDQADRIIEQEKQERERQELARQQELERIRQEAWERQMMEEMSRPRGPVMTR